jgi:hypothetical protein
LLVVTVAALTLGAIAWILGWRAVADACWAAGTLAAVVPALVWVIAALRRGRAGVDLIALLSLVGTLLVGEYVAGALIAVMLSTGRVLDAAAQRRASHDLRALLEHAPRFARRRIGDQVSVIPLGEVAVGDLLVVGPDGPRHPRDLLRRVEGESQGHHGVSLRQPRRPGVVLRRAGTGAGAGRHGVQWRLRWTVLRILTGDYCGDLWPWPARGSAA